MLLLGTMLHYLGSHIRIHSYSNSLYEYPNPFKPQPIPCFFLRKWYLWFIDHKWSVDWPSLLFRNVTSTFPACVSTLTTGYRFNGSYNFTADPWSRLLTRHINRAIMNLDFNFTCVARLLISKENLSQQILRTPTHATTRCSCQYRLRDGVWLRVRCIASLLVCWDLKFGGKMWHKLCILRMNNMYHMLQSKIQFFLYAAFGWNTLY